MSRLLLLRHAKSDWYSGALNDHGRPLNERGRKDAPRIGSWIASSGYLPDQIFCSDAQRTCETLELVMGAQGWEQHHPEIAYSHQLYMASARGVQDIIEANWTERDTLMVVGHNPTMDQLLRHYCPEARSNQSGKLMTTATVAVIEATKAKNSRLLHLIRPADL
ncbi:MAG: histidine phosphatase family protein [Gammaproteobacteria bacterium]|nr:histidine phosphatase family protein [Gammaproteobacteria bacterium]